MARLEVRSFRREDLGAFAALHNASELDNPDFIPITPDEYDKRVLSAKSYDPRGHFAALEDGRLVAAGQGACYPEHFKDGDRTGFFELYVLPDRLGTEAERAVFGRIVEYLRSMGAERVNRSADTRHASRLDQLRRLGFSRNDHENHGMERPTARMDEPPVPNGYRIRTARMPEETDEMLRVVNEAFATRGKPPIAMERFARQWTPDHPEDFSGAFVAERLSDGALVGVVVSSISRKYNGLHGALRGGSYSLAVVPSERNRGLATALLLNSCKWIGERGMRTAYLNVNVANPSALKIYSGAGYRTVQVYQGYSLSIA